MALGVGRRLGGQGTHPMPAQNTVIHLVIYFAHAQGFQDEAFHPLDAETGLADTALCAAVDGERSFAGDMP